MPDGPQGRIRLAFRSSGSEWRCMARGVEGGTLRRLAQRVAGMKSRATTGAARTPGVAKSGNDMLVSFPSVSGKTYTVERSDTLQTGSWSAVRSGIPGTGGTVQVTDTGGGTQPRRFYRVIVQ
jgi:hypothetical protein